MDTRRLFPSELSVHQLPRSKPARAALRMWDTLVGCSVGPGKIYGPLSTPKSPYPVAPSYRHACRFIGRFYNYFEAIGGLSLRGHSPDCKKNHVRATGKP
jgi:hypothetical protein